MKSIWIINHYAINPAEEASGSRHFSLARELARRGWSPVIFAASTAHPSGKQRTASRGIVDVRHNQGVSFRYLRTLSYRNGITRVLNMLCFGLVLLLPGVTRRLERPVVIVGSTVHPFAAWVAARLAKRYRVPFVFEIRDLWPQTLIDMGKLSENHPATKALRRLERYLCNQAEAVITLLPFAKEYLLEQGVPEEKVVWISNGVDIEDYPRVKAQGRSEQFTFMYLGSLGRANDVESILDAFLIAANSSERLVLKIFGNGPNKQSLMRKAAESRHNDRVQFCEPVPKSQVPEIVQSADAMVISVLDLPVYKYGVSMNKLFDYAAAARPVVIASSARNNLVIEADGGISVPAGDIPRLGAAMLQMADDARAEDRARWALNLRGFVESHFDYAVLGARLDLLLTQVVGATSTDLHRLEQSA